MFFNFANKNCFIEWFGLLELSQKLREIMLDFAMY
jgi:hypothetical protein